LKIFKTFKKNNDNKKQHSDDHDDDDDDEVRLFCIHSTLTLTPPLPAIEHEDDVMRDGAAACLSVDPRHKTQETSGRDRLQQRKNYQNRNMRHKSRKRKKNKKRTAASTTINLE
jgi:hypothetical protein